MQFESLAREHRDAVYRQMVRMCGNHDDAEDVLAEALLKAYRALDQLGDAAAFRGWLAIIARRTCGRLKQREALRPVVHLADLAEHGLEPRGDEPTPEMQALEDDTKRCIREVVDTLPPIYRDAYLLSDVDELPARDAAERLGITVPALKSRLHRARALLREGLDKELCASDA